MRQIAEQIAEQKIAAALPEIQKAATAEAARELLSALYFDVTTAVNIAFENGESIFRDKRTQRIVAESIMREIRKRLSGLMFN